MIVTTIGDTLARICNAGMSDTEAERLIDQAVTAAAAEVRQTLEQARARELDRVEYQRVREAEQAIENARDRVIFERRQAEARREAEELKRVESLQPVRIKEWNE